MSHTSNPPFPRVWIPWGYTHTARTRPPAPPERLPTPASQPVSPLGARGGLSRSLLAAAASHTTNVSLDPRSVPQTPLQPVPALSRPRPAPSHAHTHSARASPPLPIPLPTASPGPRKASLAASLRMRPPLLVLAPGRMRLTSRQSISSWCATRRVFRHRREQQAARRNSRTHTHTKPAGELGAAALDCAASVQRGESCSRRPARHGSCNGGICLLYR